jgi:hypothetical protein
MQIQIIKTLMVKLENYQLLVHLSDPKDYKGGELEFQFRNMMILINLR